jgi:hypothetical protein
MVQVLTSARTSLSGSITASDKSSARDLRHILAGREAAPEAPRSAIEAHIKAMHDEIPSSVGEDARIPGVLPAALVADDAAAELRDHEVTRLAAGEHVEGLDELLKQTPLEPRRGREAYLMQLGGAAGGPPSP